MRTPSQILLKGDILSRGIPSNENTLINTKDFGNFVRKMRKKAKLTQAQVAGMCNVGTRFLSDFEKGKSTVELGKVLQVLKGFGLQVTLVPRHSHGPLGPTNQKRVED